jgi:hypothetical protein
MKLKSIYVIITALLALLLANMLYILFNNVTLTSI